MNSEELKRKYSMAAIVKGYGLLPNKAGFISCPFHKEKTASMKVYADSYHCFGCGESGDIFTFVQKMEDISFKEAFLSLGGEYEKPTFESKLAVYKQTKRRITNERRSQRLKSKKSLNNMLIDIYRNQTRKSEPFSDVWTDCHNALQYQLYIHEVLNREEVGGCGL